jgi:hypothetical protein
MEKLRKKGSPDKEMGMKLDSYGRVEILFKSKSLDIERLLRMELDNHGGCGNGCERNFEGCYPTSQEEPS